AASATGNPEWRLAAHHYEQAERFDEASSACLQAAAIARQRGALAEARTYLTRALRDIERLEPGPARDEREIAVRLQRGFLSSVVMGHASSEAAADFEHCLQLLGANVSPQLYATLNALWSYYAARGDLRRATRMTETLNVGLRTGKGNRRLILGVAGMLAWLKGEFDTARENLEAAEPGDDLSAPMIEKAWFAPNEPFASVYTYVALSRFVQGDLVGAEAELAQSERRCQQVGFPHGTFSLCYLRSLETWIRIEAGQLDVAAERARDLAHLAKQYGFDEWTLVAATQRATVRALTALSRDSAADILQQHVETMTGFVDAWRAIELKIFLMCYDSVLARLLTAVGRPDAARARVDSALELADETLLHFYDGELLRVRAHTFDDPDARHAGLREAVELARHQGATIFELRVAADDFELTGTPARAALVEAVGRFPPEQSWPELARARALLG
ncbi:MAG: ATP-binding protein, partial [Mycobacterium sp.]